MKVFSCLVVCFCLLLSACDTIDVFEKTESFPAFQWASSNKPVFRFNIVDTNSLYNIYVVLRHQDDYHYNNLWMNITITPPKSTPVTHKWELILADNGKGWRGSGMDDIFTHRITLFHAVPLKKGEYQFALQQIMRENPLQSVLDAGIRVEKATP